MNVGRLVRGYCSCESETRVLPKKMERSVDVERDLGSRPDAENGRN